QSFSTTKKIVKQQSYHQRYVNYAPVLFEWSQKLNSGQLTMDSLLASQQFQRVSENVCDTIHTTPKRALIFETLIRTIGEKLDESKASMLDLVQLSKFNRYFTPEIIIKIEDQLMRYLDSDEEIPLDNLCYLLVLLSRHNRRNKNLIRSVVAKLLKYHPEEIYTMPPHLIHMISSLKRLNFPEINLLEKCSDILVNFKFLENLSESSKRDFTVAVSNFNFSYPKLNDYYLQTLIDKPDIFKHQDLITLTITLSRLNYQREDLVDIIMEQIVPKISAENCASRYQWFNFVNSLMQLRCATVDHVKSILRNQFYVEMEQEELETHLNILRERQAKNSPEENGDSSENEKLDSNTDDLTVISGHEIYRMMNIRRKYCVLNGMLTLQSDSRIIDPNTRQSMGKIPIEQFFDNEEEMKNFQTYLRTFDLSIVKRSKDLQEFQKKLIQTFDTFAPSKDKYMLVDIKTPFGFVIDAELLVDLEGKPQMLDKPKISSEDSKMNNMQRSIALMCIGFNETLLDDNSRFIGPKDAELSLLASLGYVVIPIHQNSLPQSVTSLN
ncbi:cell cycle progression protein, partial [Euroglyphus maynei]